MKALSKVAGVATTSAATLDVVVCGGSSSPANSTFVGIGRL